MKKKIIFLDGDGTLWYPKTTKRTVNHIGFIKILVQKTII